MSCFQAPYLVSCAGAREQANTTLSVGSMLLRIVSPIKDIKDRKFDVPATELIVLGLPRSMHPLRFDSCGSVQLPLSTPADRAGLSLQ
jgi:hypothetical protein